MIARRPPAGRLLRTPAAPGTGAERQRAAWERAQSPADLVSRLADATGESEYQAG